MVKTSLISFSKEARGRQTGLQDEGDGPHSPRSQRAFPRVVTTLGGGGTLLLPGGFGKASTAAPLMNV